MGSKLVNKSDSGFFLDIMLGIVGAVVAGFAYRFFGTSGVSGLNLYSLLAAVFGSVFMLLIYHAWPPLRRSLKGDSDVSGNL